MAAAAIPAPADGVSKARWLILIGLILADPMVAMIKIWLEREAARHEAERVG